MHHLYSPALCLSVLLTLPAAAQNQPAPAGVLWANTVEARISSRGELFSPDGTPGLRAHTPGLADHPLAQGGGLWIMTRNAQGELVGAVHGYAQQPGDYMPGPAGIPQFENVWSVSCSDINEHLADLADNGAVDAPHPAVFGWPASGNTFYADIWAQVGLSPGSPHLLGGFFDSDNTTFYEPPGGDYPSIDIRGCPNERFPNQNLWTAANDHAPHARSGLEPMNIEVQLQPFALRVMPEASILNQAVFIRYNLINRSTELYDSIYVGLWTDFHLGSSDADDYAGSDVSRRLLYGYDASATAGAMPAVAFAMLQGPLAEDPVTQDVLEAPLQHLMIVDALPGAPEPEAWYNLLHGRYADGTPAPNNGIPYPGNPNDPNGLSEATAGNAPGRRHGIATFGPFRLNPGAVNEFITAYFYAYTPGAGALENVQTLYDSIAVLQNAINTCFDNLDVVCTPVVAAPALPPVPPARLYPNPAASSCTVERPGAPFERLEVFDLTGRRVQAVALDAATERTELVITALPAGFYTLRLGGTTVVPLAVQR
jgi:hypothetical protein